MINIYPPPSTTFYGRSSALSDHPHREISTPEYTSLTCTYAKNVLDTWILYSERPSTKCLGSNDYSSLGVVVVTGLLVDFIYDAREASSYRPPAGMFVIAHLIDIVGRRVPFTDTGPPFVGVVQR